MASDWERLLQEERRRGEVQTEDEQKAAFDRADEIRKFERDAQWKGRPRPTRTKAGDSLFMVRPGLAQAWTHPPPIEWNDPKGKRLGRINGKTGERPMRAGSHIGVVLAVRHNQLFTTCKIRNPNSSQHDYVWVNVWSSQNIAGDAQGVAFCKVVTAQEVTAADARVLHDGTYPLAMFLETGELPGEEKLREDEEVSWQKMSLQELYQTEAPTRDLQLQYVPKARGGSAGPAASSSSGGPGEPPPKATRLSDLQQVSKRRDRSRPSRPLDVMAAIGEKELDEESKPAEPKLQLSRDSPLTPSKCPPQSLGPPPKKPLGSGTPAKATSQPLEISTPMQIVQLLQASQKPVPKPLVTPPKTKTPTPGKASEGSAGPAALAKPTPPACPPRTSGRR